MSSDLTGEISRQEKRQFLILPTSESQSPSFGRDPDPPCPSHRPRAGVARLREWPAGRFSRCQPQPRHIPPARRCRKENLRQERLHPMFSVYRQNVKIFCSLFIIYVFLYLIVPAGGERYFSESFPDVERHPALQVRSELRTITLNLTP